MSLSKELWHPIVLERLYDGYKQMQSIATEDSGFLIKQGSRFRKVHIANAGGLGSNITKNDSTLALTPTKRTDVKVEYDLDKYELGPNVIDRETVLSTAYDTINSNVQQMLGNMSEGLAYEIRKTWFADDFMIETSGSGVTATFGTGERAMFTYDDVLLAKRKLDSQKMPLQDRYLLLGASHANDLLEDLFKNNYNVRWVEKDNLSILDQKVLGFTIVQFPVVLMGEVSGSTIVPLSYEEAPTDPGQLTEVSFAYHKNYVSMSKDDVHIFYEADSPIFRGDILTLQSFCGGGLRDNDGIGVIPIVGKVV